MSQLAQATQIRLPKIKQGLLKKQTRQEMATTCNISRKTITRDIQAWVVTEDFFNWIREVWLDKYRTVDDIEAFRQATKIIIKTMIARAEMKAELYERKEITIDLSLISDDDKSILDKAATILNRKSKRDFSKIH